MLNRRAVIQAGAAGMAAALVNLPSLGRPAFARDAAPAHCAFHRVVFDERFAESRAFAAELNSVGVFTSAIRGDVADLWYGDLRGHLSKNLSKNRSPVAGMTDRAALFCLEELARDVGMRVIFRADHIIAQRGDQNGHAQHTAVGPASLVAGAHNLTPEGFGRTIAGLFGQFDINEARDPAAQKRTGPFGPGNTTALVSWLLG